MFNHRAIGGHLSWVLLLDILATGQALCPTRLIYQTPTKDNWFENLAVRRNGSILVTSIDAPGFGLYTVNPSEPNPQLYPVVKSFPGVNSTLGITETTPDVFYIIGSNFSLSPATEGGKKGTNAIFEVKFCPEPEVRTIANVTEAVNLNGLTTFNDTTILAADSAEGKIYAIDTATGAYYVAAQNDPLMQGMPNPPSAFPEGINGLHILPGTNDLYFTNSQKRLFAKTTLSVQGRIQIAPAEFIANSITQSGTEVDWDDFDLDHHGNAYIATEEGNGIQRVSRNGTVEVFAGDVNSTAIAESTSAHFGRTERDRGLLYVTTAGGTAYPVYENGKAMQTGAQVVAVDIGACFGWEHGDGRHPHWQPDTT